MPRVRLTTTLVLLAWLAVSASPVAIAQTQSITPGRSSDAEIQSFAAAQVARLSSGDPAACAAGRNALLAPLRTPDTPPAFRLAYSTALARSLPSLVSGSDDLAAINAIEVVSELATGLTVSTLLPALEDTRVAVRYAAARGVGRALASVADGRAAIPGNQVDQLIAGAGARLAVEPDPQVADALIRSFSAPEGDPQLLARCLRTMCEAMTRQIADWRKSGPTEATALVAFRAANTAFQWLFNQTGGVQNDRAFAQAAAVMAGQAVSFASRWLEVDPPSQMSDEQKQAAVDLAGAAERVMILSHMLLAQESVRETITPAVTGLMQGRRAIGDVQRETAAWTGPSGRLAKAPYNASADSFR